MASLNDKEILQKVEFLTGFYYNKFNVKEPLPDIFADIYVTLERYKYIERWDGKRPLHNYLSGFIYNHFCKLFKRESYNVSRAEYLEDYLYTDSNETIESRISIPEERDEDLSISIKNIISKFKHRETFNSYILYDENMSLIGVYETKVRKPKKGDIILKRSLAQVLELSYLGLSQTEIKRLLQVSKSWVSKQLSYISEDNDFKNLAKEYGISRK